jgi:hypothetical protein
MSDPAFRTLVSRFASWGVSGEGHVMAAASVSMPVVWGV